MYTQNLYKADLDNILFKKSKEENDLSNSNANAEPAVGKSIDDTIKEMHPKLASDKTSTKANTASNFQYAKLCDKLGFDLTSKGELVVRLDSCDRLPEAIYSLNLPQLNQANSHLLPAPVQPAINNLDPFIYITLSVDKVSMKSLMERQICKEHWPLIEFEFIKTTQPLAVVFKDQFFINKNEVVVQQVAAQTSTTNGLQMFDIVHSINQVRIGSVKHLNKLVQKALSNTSVKVVVQRPCILMENTVLTSSTSLVNTAAAIKLDSTASKSIESIKHATQTPIAAAAAQTATTPLANNTPVSLNNNASASLFPNTRLKLESLFEKKLKLFVNTANPSPAGLPAISPNTPTAIGGPSTTLATAETAKNTSAENEAQPDADIPATTASQSQTNLNLLQLGQQAAITASSTCLIDYYCSVAERALVSVLN